MKKLINDVRAVVPDALQGVVRLAPGLRLLARSQTVVRSDIDAVIARGEVTLISGGGAGHEPAHAGYVGAGMLSAAVAGDVFTSPSVDAVLDAIRAVGGPGGVLLIVKNYTGDRLNFGLAAELARAEGIATELVVVADDVALDLGGDHAGRRGIAGTVLIHKIAGAAAAAGWPLADVRDAALKAIDQVGTMGVALSACTVPAAGQPGFSLGDDEIELGLGIHGEAGVARSRIEPSASLVDRIVSRIVSSLALKSGSRVALLVNNLGATPAMELSIVARDALAAIEAKGIRVERAWAGGFLTALEMAGMSLSLLQVDDAMLAALDAPTTAAAWPAAHLGRVAALDDDAIAASAIDAAAGSAQAGQRPLAGSASAMGSGRPTSGSALLDPITESIRAVCNALIDAEPELTRLDQAAGDGDLGISLTRGSQAVLAALDGAGQSGPLPERLRSMSGLLRRVLGGTSGPLYAIFLLRAAATLESASASAPTEADRLVAALHAGTEAIAQIGGARAGDRTMLDALFPAIEAARTGLNRPTERGSLAALLSRAAEAARQGADATRQIAARRGRASYLGERAIGVPDPGAVAVGIMLRALADVESRRTR